ncbi:type VII secretion target [Actinokineospora sp. HUAS TT18]|uniref:type VII secretion target n=1 Tax=Actinokineospora sp. HUAS TT18 TaxID=3447451 RepID=UPI003F51B3CB
MPDGKYDVVVDELRAHASRLDGLAERLNTAANAGNEVTMGTEAYGKICAFFVPIVQSVSEPGLDALASAAGRMGETAAGVRGTADGYDQTEQGNAQSLGGGR